MRCGSDAECSSERQGVNRRQNGENTSHNQETEFISEKLFLIGELAGPGFACSQMSTLQPIRVAHDSALVPVVPKRFAKRNLYIVRPLWRGHLPR